MAVKVEIKTNENTKLLKGLERFQKTKPQFVKVGFVQGVKQNRKADENTNAGLAYINEHGSPYLHIPPRPFLIPAFKSEADLAESRITKGMAREMVEVGAIEKGLGEAGKIIRDKAKSNIVNSVGMKPLSPRTLQARQDIGFKGTKPLIHTAQLLNSITYVVK